MMVSSTCLVLRMLGTTPKLTLNMRLRGDYVSVMGDFKWAPYI